MPTRTIAVVTTSRADYGHLFWPMRALQDQPEIDLKLIVTGAHLAPEFGQTVDEIERDGFTIDHRVECLLSSDSDVGMAKTIGIGTMAFADVLGEMRPDLLLLIADRYELLAPASAALALRIPIAHIEGGEISQGAIDQQVRDALTKFSHLHFTPTKQSAQRVISMDEEPWRVHCVGAPSLDHLRQSRLLDSDELKRKLRISFHTPPIVVAYHPVTIERETTIECDAVFTALEKINQPIVFCFPNADSGGRSIIQRARSFCDARSNAQLFINLPHLVYWSLLKLASCMIGNSSSGIMESPALKLPAVNIGKRQRGREQAMNIIDVKAQVPEIVNGFKTAQSPEFRASLKEMSNPYGDGHAGERIACVLCSTPIDGRLMEKRITPAQVDGLVPHAAMMPA